MMKRYKDAKNLFDNEEEQVAKEMMAAAGTTQNENVPAPAGNESTLSADYLEKILQIQRNFSSQQEQSEKIMRSLNGLVRRLEGSKDIKVSLSEDDKNMLSALPVTINKHVAITVGQAGQKVKEDIDKHTESTMNSITKACDTKSEEVMRVLNNGKGIYLSWWNFWIMIIMTIASTSYATYAAAGHCLWDQLWERLWVPFLFLVLICGGTALIFWLNYREYKMPKF